MRKTILCILLALIMGLAVFALSSCENNAADTSVSETDKRGSNHENDQQNTVTEKFSAVQQSAASPSPATAKETAPVTTPPANKNASTAVAGNSSNNTADSSAQLSEGSRSNTAEQGQPYRQESSSATIDEEQTQSADPPNICSFVIDCSNALSSDKLSDSLRRVLPTDGIIYSSTSVEFSDGETVFDILSRITRDSGIPMEFSSSPVYGSKYIEGINSLYEFECGELSGWQYKVNEVFPNYGCDAYTVHSGDNIGFYYTTDLGEDLN